MALKNMKVNFRHAFSCDNDKHSKDFIRKNFSPEQFFDDIQRRDVNSIPHMDLYIAGFPCQPFSIGGFRKGLDDCRGKLVYDVMNVITTKLPRMFLLENVKVFTTIDGGKYLRQVIRFLKQIRNGENEPAYWVHWKVIDTKEQGIPHARKRWYCIGLSRSDFKNGKDFCFPNSLPCSTIQSFLDDSTPLGGAEEESSNVQTNILRAFSQSKERGHDAAKECILIDVDASQRHMSWKSGVSPCLTRS